MNGHQPEMRQYMNRFYNRNSISLRFPKDPHDYAVWLVANYCMPTLLMVKPASLITVNKRISGATADFMKHVEAEVVRFGSSFEILYEDERMVNLLIYNREMLSRLLTSKETELFLMSYGYEYEQDPVQNVFSHLKQNLCRYNSNKMKQQAVSLVMNKTYHRNEASADGSLYCFPHEIGVILGYPRMDVEDFVKYQGKNYILNGYWKVYHNVEDALRIFELYQDIRETAVGFLNEGTTLGNTISIMSILNKK